MPRLHQLNQFQYNANTENELLLGLQANDGIIFIEEAVLRLAQPSQLISHAKALNIRLYGLEQDLLAHGLTSDLAESISVEKWLTLTASFDNHIAW